MITLLMAILVRRVDGGASISLVFPTHVNHFLGGPYNVLYGMVAKKRFSMAMRVSLYQPHLL